MMVEISPALQALKQKHDTDGDGLLSNAEFLKMSQKDKNQMIELGVLADDFLSVDEWNSLSKEQKTELILSGKLSPEMISSAALLKVTSFLAEPPADFTKQLGEALAGKTQANGNRLSVKEVQNKVNLLAEATGDKHLVNQLNNMKIPPGMSQFEFLMQKVFALYKKLRATVHLSMSKQELAEFKAAISAADSTHKAAIASGVTSIAFSGFALAGASSYFLKRGYSFGKSFLKGGKSPTPPSEKGLEDIKNLDKGKDNTQTEVNKIIKDTNSRAAEEGRKVRLKTEELNEVYAAADARKKEKDFDELPAEKQAEKIKEVVNKKVNQIQDRHTAEKVLAEREKQIDKALDKWANKELKQRPNETRTEFKARVETAKAEKREQIKRDLDENIANQRQALGKKYDGLPDDQKIEYKSKEDFISKHTEESVNKELDNVVKELKGPKDNNDTFGSIVNGMIFVVPNLGQGASQLAGAGDTHDAEIAKAWQQTHSRQADALSSDEKALDDSLLQAIRAAGNT
ncbi:MAG: hypothetical protein ACK5NY_10900 [Burkholderiaceae bacterium]